MIPLLSTDAELRGGEKEREERNIKRDVARGRSAWGRARGRERRRIFY